MNTFFYAKQIKLLFLVLVCCTFISKAQVKQNRPNIIQILTDDQGWGDLGSFGHDFIKTPHIDKLATEGIKFSNCYLADAVCTPSRSAILTGRTAYRNGVFNTVPLIDNSVLPSTEITLPQLLKNEGYQTAHFGKWHLSHFFVAIPKCTLDFIEQQNRKCSNNILEKISKSQIHAPFGFIYSLVLSQV